MAQLLEKKIYVETAVFGNELFLKLSEHIRGICMSFTVIIPIKIYSKKQKVEKIRQTECSHMTESNKSEKQIDRQTVT